MEAHAAAARVDAAAHHVQVLQVCGQQPGVARGGGTQRLDVVLLVEAERQLKGPLLHAPAPAVTRPARTSMTDASPCTGTAAACVAVTKVWQPVSSTAAHKRAARPGSSSPATSSSHKTRPPP